MTNKEILNEDKQMHRCTDAQIIAILRQAEDGVPVAHLCREHGMPRQTSACQSVGAGSATPDIVEAVCQPAKIVSDNVIAGVLNRNGLATGNGNRWTKERVSQKFLG